LRGHLAEFGVIAPQGLRNVGKLIAIVRDEGGGVAARGARAAAGRVDSMDGCFLEPIAGTRLDIKYQLAHYRQAAAPEDLDDFQFEDTPVDPDCKTSAHESVTLGFRLSPVGC
jgi:hypothetical protein